MKRLIVLVMVLVLCVSLAACGTGSSAVPTQAAAGETQASVSSQSAASSQTPAATTASSQSGSSVKRFDTVEDYLNDPTVQSQIETSKDASKGMGLDVEVYAEGDTLVYDYTYQTQYTDEQVEMMKTQLDKSLESSAASAFDTVVDELKTQVNEPNPKVKVIYRNADGTIITSKTYSGN